MTGTVIYEGSSQLDGEPIVCVLTFGSENAKTGDMAQTWILRQDMPPTDAARTGADRSICGECPLAGRRDGTLQGRSCYVNIGHGPLAIWRAWKRGVYGRALDFQLPTVGQGLRIRLGAYGDPAAVPVWVWDMLTLRASGWTGYTHQYGRPRFDLDLLQYVMVSVESERQARALPEGVRYFRVRRHGEKRLRSEMQCPAASEAPTHGRIKCSDCMMCDGGGGRRSVSLQAHGFGASAFK